jgi:hypothetical protein
MNVIWMVDFVTEQKKNGSSSCGEMERFRLWRVEKRSLPQKSASVDRPLTRGMNSGTVGLTANEPCCIRWIAILEVKRPRPLWPSQL